QDVDLLGVEQPLGLVDRHLGLGLAVAVGLDDLVLAEHAALLVDVVDDHLRPAPAVQRAGGGERAGLIEQDPDLDGLALGDGEARTRDRGGDGASQQRPAGDVHRRNLLGTRRARQCGVSSAATATATDGTTPYTNWRGDRNRPRTWIPRR